MHLGRSSKFVGVASVSFLNLLAPFIHLSCKLNHNGSQYITHYSYHGYYYITMTKTTKLQITLLK